MPDTTTSSSDVGALVAEGNAALIAGDSYAARQCFRQALELDPGRVEAWIGLAGSVRPYREKLEHLQRALAIDPANAEARAVIAQVETRLAAGEVLAPGGVQLRGSPDQAGPPLPTAPASAATALTCYLHPDRETGLRCTSCERPICSDCARPAVVGQLCPECARIRRPVNYQVTGTHIAIAGGATLLYSTLLTTLGLLLLGNLGFFSFIIAFLLGPVAGELLVRLLDRLTRSKRGRPVQVTVGVAYGLGILLMLAGLAFVLGNLSPAVVGRLLFSMPLGLYLFTGIAIVTALTRLR
ncbi:MAG: hypothetical protein HGA45_17550 [Chloroflexales bacterium]|nr:hypothetical protein [Chloroflexales bacterium]